MNLGQGVGLFLVLAALDQAVRGLWGVRTAAFSPAVLSLQAFCLAGALILLAVLSVPHGRLRAWHVLIAAGCLSGLLERVFFGHVTLPFALGTTGQSDWTAFAFADMYIAAGGVAAYWKHELQERQADRGNGTAGGT